MLKQLNMALVCCPVGFSEAIIAVFHVKKSQIDTEIDKKPKVFQFSKILSIFPKFSTDFVNWNVQNQHRERQNFETIPIFTIFVQIVSKYR